MINEPEPLSKVAEKLVDKVAQDVGYTYPYTKIFSARAARSVLLFLADRAEGTRTDEGGAHAHELIIWADEVTRVLVELSRDEDSN
jgi:hypothetical protein